MLTPVVCLVVVPRASRWCERRSGGGASRGSSSSLPASPTCSGSSAVGTLGASKTGVFLQLLRCSRPRSPYSFGDVITFGRSSAGANRSLAGGSILNDAAGRRIPLPVRSSLGALTSPLYSAPDEDCPFRPRAPMGIVLPAENALTSEHDGLGFLSFRPWHVRSRGRARARGAEVLLEAIRGRGRRRGASASTALLPRGTTSPVSTPRRGRCSPRAGARTSRIELGNRRHRHAVREPPRDGGTSPRRRPHRGRGGLQLGI